MKVIKQEKVNELLKAVLMLENLAEARAFFRDLLTEKELLEFGSRWEAARMLSQRKPYWEIQKKTKLSSRTIARVAKWLSNGEGGYKKLIKKIDKNHHNKTFPLGRELS